MSGSPETIAQKVKSRQIADWPDGALMIWQNELDALQEEIADLRDQNIALIGIEQTAQRMREILERELDQVLALTYKPEGRRLWREAYAEQWERGDYDAVLQKAWQLATGAFV